MYQRGSLTTCSVLRGCCVHFTFFLIPQKPCRSLQRNEYRRWSTQSLIPCLGGTSCHSVLFSSCSSSVFQNWQSAFTHVRTFHPSNNWDLGGYTGQWCFRFAESRLVFGQTYWFQIRSSSMMPFCQEFWLLLEKTISTHLFHKSLSNAFYCI